MMNKPILLALAMTFALTAIPGQAKSPPKTWPELGVETSIPFANFRGIRNFEADGNDGVWLEDNQRRWYYATLLGPCLDLNFAQAIGYDTRGSSTFDKFSTILVGHNRCPVTSVVTAAKPLPRKEREKLRKEVRESAKEVVAPPVD